MGEDRESWLGAVIEQADTENPAEGSKWYPSYRFPVKITCWPSEPKANDRVVIRHSNARTDMLLEEKNGRIYPAASEYKWGEVNDMKFWLVGTTTSSRVRDRMISVSNTVNGCHDEALYTVMKLESIEVGCSKMPTNLGRLLKNPETFEPECDFFGRPDLNPPYWWEPGTYSNPASKVFLLFYKYVSDNKRRYKGCEINLKANVLPPDVATSYGVHFSWELLDGPKSGQFSNTNSFMTSYCFKDPTIGGMYKFRCTINASNCSTWGDGWALLPKAGGEVSNWIAAEVPIAISRATNWIYTIDAVAIANGRSIVEFREEAWIAIASECFDYQGVVGTPTKRYSFVDDDRPSDHVPEPSIPGMAGKKGNGDWDEPSFATLSGVVVSRSKISNLFYAIWGRTLGYSERSLKLGAWANAKARGEKETCSSRNSISLGSKLFRACRAGESLSGKITRSTALGLQTSGKGGLNDVNLWPDCTPVIHGFEFPVMETDYTELTDIYNKTIEKMPDLIGIFY